MAHLLGAEGLHLEYPTKVVFDSVTLGIEEGDRIGIVGRNGDGKSSLLAMLAGRQAPDAGRVTVRGGVTIGVLDQADALDDDETVGHAVVGDAAEHEWAGDARVRDVISGLLADLDWYARLGTLSGGQRRRVALAHLLAGDHDVLALDEPTNHLDVEAIAWLAAHLKTRWSPTSGALLIVTHDRWFLDEPSARLGGTRFEYDHTCRSPRNLAVFRGFRTPWRKVAAGPTGVGTGYRSRSGSGSAKVNG